MAAARKTDKYSNAVIAKLDEFTQRHAEIRTERSKFLKDESKRERELDARQAAIIGKWIKANNPELWKQSVAALTGAGDRKAFGLGQPPVVALSDSSPEQPESDRIEPPQGGFSLSESGGSNGGRAGGSGHAREVEDQTGLGGEPVDQAGDRATGVGVQSERADGQAALARPVFGAVAGADPTEDVVPGHVEHAVTTVLDAPPAAADS